MKCADYKRNLGNAFGFGGPAAVPCRWDATHAVKMGKSAVKTVNGWRPVCRICAGRYAGYKVAPIEDADLTEPEST